MRWRDTKKGAATRSIPKKSPSSLVFSPFSLRLKAITIDSFMILMPILYLVFYAIFGSREAFSAHMFEGWLLILVPHFLITTLFLVFKGQTPGMKAYDLQLFKSKTHEKPTIVQFTLRYFLGILTAISLFGLLTPLFRNDKQSLYDMLSRTTLIKSH